MELNTVVFKRRNILGELYKQCDPVDAIPVFLKAADGELVGTVEDSPNLYDDAFLFRLPVAVCKKLSANGYDIIIDYDFAGKDKILHNDRVKLNHIILADKKGSLPFPKRNR